MMMNRKLIKNVSLVVAVLTIASMVLFLFIPALY
jgi:hypothetical protein